MRKTAIAIIFMLLFFSVDAPCETSQEFFTNGMLNGRFALKCSDANDMTPVTYYVTGVTDFAYLLDPGNMQKHYPGFTKKEIINAVLNYYRANPGQATRAILDVIVSGCK